MESLRYPIGRFQYNKELTTSKELALIQTLEELPSQLEKLVCMLSPEDLAKTYRLDGWTVKQVVHHLADSHANMYIRVKTAMANSGASIIGYDEGVWANFADNELPAAVSVQILRGIHARLCHQFRHFEKSDWDRTYFHTGERRLFTLHEVVALYAWHAEHHLAHIYVALKS